MAQTGNKISAKNNIITDILLASSRKKIVATLGISNHDEGAVEKKAVKTCFNFLANTFDICLKKGLLGTKKVVGRPGKRGEERGGDFPRDLEQRTINRIMQFPGNLNEFHPEGNFSTL